MRAYDVGSYRSVSSQRRGWNEGDWGAKAGPLRSAGGGGYAGHGAVLCAFLRVRHWGGGSVCTTLSSHFMTLGCVLGHLSNLPLFFFSEHTVISRFSNKFFFFARCQKG